MKKLNLSLISLIAITLFACHNPQKDAESAAKSYVKSKLNDPASYEAVSFGKIDTVYSTFETSPAGKGISKQFIDLVNDIKANSSRYDDIKDQNSLSAIKYYDWYNGSKFDVAEHKSMDSLLTVNKLLLAKSESMDIKIKQMEKSFKKEPDGFSLVHSFRAKNAMGALMLDEYKIVLNKKFEVTSAESIKQ